MGASAREIEQEIKETRERMDENLGALETRAASGARRYGTIAAKVVGAVAVGGVAILVWRRTRRPSLKDRLDRLSPEAMRDLAEELAARLKKPLPAVKVAINEEPREPSVVSALFRNVAPAIVGTAISTLLRRAARPQNERGVEPSGASRR